MDASVEVDLPGTGVLGRITGSADDNGVIGAIDRNAGRYERHLMAFLAQVARSNDICLDVGANIGVMSLLLARLCPGGAVYAFEPGAASCDYLRRNVRDNELRNVTVENCGLYDVTATLQFAVDGRHPGGAHLVGSAAGDATHERVHVTRLDDWMTTRRLDRIDLVKMDIEGAEVRALEGAESTLRRLRPLITVECNPVALQRFQCVNADDLVRRLQSIYGRVYYLEDTILRAVESTEHTARLLDVLGVLDLVCGARAEPPPRPTPRRPRWRRAAGRVLRHYRRRVPAMNYLHDPAYDAHFGVHELVASAGTTVTVPIRLRNTSQVWFSSTFPNHPMHASYHWLDARGSEVEHDGLRTVFAQPLGPRREAKLALAVALPSAPGNYELVFALVQEGYAWADDLRPDLARRLPVRVG